MPPRWTRRACLVALFVGLALVIVGPMLVYSLAAASVDASLTPEQLEDPQQRQAAMEQGFDKWRSRFLWIMPAGMGLTFFGVIGLLFVWVTKLAEEAGTNRS